MKASIFKSVYFTLSVFLASVTLYHIVLAKTPVTLIPISPGEFFFDPDSTEEDTLLYQEGDTIAIYVSGLDSTIVIYADTTGDSQLENAWVINNPDKRMIVSLGNQHAPVNMGLIGVNLTDFFEPAKVPQDKNINYTVVPDPWEALVALAPKTVRIFSGASARFMHPLGSYDPVEDITYCGYGYNWKEMVSYFDATNFVYDDAPDDGMGGYDYEAILEQIENPDAPELPCDDCDEWMDENSVSRFLEFYGKCTTQAVIEGAITDLETAPLYINDLIDLVHAVQDGNPGHIIDVLYCANIFSMSATELTEVIDYLQDNDINLVGIEMGNEEYFESAALLMGFTDFEHYYQYINGEDYTDPDEQEKLDAALDDDMEDDHDYIAAIKGDTDYWDIKIGLPARNTPDCGAGYDFPLFAPDPDGGNEQLSLTDVITEPDPSFDPCDCFYPQWNLDMAEHYEDITITSEEEHYNFDAIIFHPYYGTVNTSASCEVNSNWRDIMLDLYEQVYKTTLSPPDPTFQLEEHLTDIDYDLLQFTSGIWQYYNNPPPAGNMDNRLNDAFKQIIGMPSSSYIGLRPGNFKELVRDRLDISFEEHAFHMKFTHDDDGPETKEVWLTEYNLADEVVLPPSMPDYKNEELFQDFEAAVSNTFAHAVLLQNWFLWNVKANYQSSSYRNYFLTRATLQNFLGGSSTMLMTNSDKEDQVALGEIGGCDGTYEQVRPYFVRRATYYATELWRVIHDNDLQYLKSVTTMASLNDNLAPSVFIGGEPGDLKLFVFYTNVQSYKQWFGIDPAFVVEIFEDPADYEAILSDDIDAVILDPSQPYSTAGKNELFDINAYYNDCDDAAEDEHRFNITGLETYSPAVTCPGGFDALCPNGVCLEMPGISMGYFIIPFDIVELRKANPHEIFSLQPNPANTSFYIQQVNTNLAKAQSMQIEIYDMMNNKLSASTVEEYDAVDISELPVGVYTVIIKSENIETGIEQLVKMK